MHFSVTHLFNQQKLVTGLLYFEVQSIVLRRVFCWGRATRAGNNPVTCAMLPQPRAPQTLSSRAPCWSLAAAQPRQEGVSFLQSQAESSRLYSCPRALPTL